MSTPKQLHVTWNGRGSTNPVSETYATFGAAGVLLEFIAGPIVVSVAMSSAQARGSADMLIRDGEGEPPPIDPALHGIDGGRTLQ